MYLVHRTSKRNLVSILDSGFIYSQNEMVVNKINPKNGFSLFMNKFEPFDDQYQGVYMTITKNSFFTREFFLSSILIIFDLSLLFEDNKYHFNPSDSNGCISDTSYFPEDLETILSLDLNYLNEVVFHHKIDIKFAKLILTQETYTIPKELSVFHFESNERSKKYLKKCENFVRRKTPGINTGGYIIDNEDYENFKRLYMKEWNEIVLKECTCKECI